MKKPALLSERHCLVGFPRGSVLHFVMTLVIRLFKWTRPCLLRCFRGSQTRCRSSRTDFGAEVDAEVATNGHDFGEIGSMTLRQYVDAYGSVKTESWVISVALPVVRREKDGRRKTTVETKCGRKERRR